MIITLDMQIAAARRESMLRRRVYPGWVGSGRMKQAEADKEIAAMEAIEATLIELRETGKLVWPFVDSGKTERTKPMMSEDGPSHSPSMTFEQRVEKSSRVCFVDYDPGAAELSVVFRTNPVRYVYLDYPPRMWEELRQAQSIGSFLFHNVTRPKDGVLPYKFEKRALPDGFVMPPRDDKLGGDDLKRIGAKNAKPPQGEIGF